MFATRMTLAVRIWAAAATALAAAAGSDVLAEVLSNAGFLGGGAMSDVHQEAAMPVALLAIAAVLTLATLVALRARDARVLDTAATRAQAPCWAAGTLIATMLVIVFMEAYETRLGGLGAFDPHAVLVAHAPAALLACAGFAMLVNRVVACSLRLAQATGIALAHAIVRVLERSGRGGVQAIRRAARGSRIVVRELLLARRAHQLRAPPFCRLHPMQSLT